MILQSALRAVFYYGNTRREIRHLLISFSSVNLKVQGLPCLLLYDFIYVNIAEPDKVNGLIKLLPILKVQKESPIYYA